MNLLHDFLTLSHATLSDIFCLIWVFGDIFGHTLEPVLHHNTYLVHIYNRKADFIVGYMIKSDAASEYTLSILLSSLTNI